MKKTDPELVERIREHARQHPEDTYEEIAITYGVAEITVKRLCADLGRSKSRRKKRSSQTLGERLWSKVDRKPDGCWLWSGCKTPDGYGFMHAGERSLPVHRIAFELTKGAIPVGMELDHLCRVRACCNPEHLEPVTPMENKIRAGIIPAPRSNSTDTLIVHIDTHQSIDTADFGPVGINENPRSPHINTDSIKALNMDTRTPLIPVSMADSKRTTTPENPSTKRQVVVNTSRPRSADPFSAICTMEAPPELEPVKVPEHYEPEYGTKTDIGVGDWAETEFGNYWWGQTEDHLREHTVWSQTEAMREAGEFLHWYQVNSTIAGKAPTHMSARSGPEACVKVERNFGKGWAQSWKYVAPDPHRGPFFEYKAFLVDGDIIQTVARTLKDAISMIEAVGGRGRVLYAERHDRVSDGHLRTWMKSWKELLKNQFDGIATRQSNRRGR